MLSLHSFSPARLEPRFPAYSYALIFLRAVRTTPKHFSHDRLQQSHPSPSPEPTVKLPLFTALPPTQCGSEQAILHFHFYPSHSLSHSLRGSLEQPLVPGNSTVSSSCPAVLLTDAPLFPADTNQIFELALMLGCFHCFDTNPRTDPTGACGMSSVLNGSKNVRKIANSSSQNRRRHEWHTKFLHSTPSTPAETFGQSVV